MNDLCVSATQPVDKKRAGESHTSRALKKRSDSRSNKKGQFSLFQINTAAEEAILAISESLSEANDEIFNKATNENIKTVLKQALSMIT